MTTLVAVGAVALSLGACKKAEEPTAPPITAPYSDSFERVALGDDWHPTAANYHIKDGALSAKGAYNHPLWLRRPMPKSVSIEVEVWSNTGDGDIKVELFGDGRSFARNKGQYTSTGYVAVFGGWNNSLSILAKGNEHGSELVKRTQPKVEVGKRYKWKIVRKGGVIDWFIDDMETPFLSLQDKAPLSGDSHRFFAVNNWESDTWFDNLVITPL